MANMVAVGLEPCGIILLTEASHYSLSYINYINKGLAALHPILTFLAFTNTNVMSINPIDILQICFKGSKHFDLNRRLPMGRGSATRKSALAKSFG